MRTLLVVLMLLLGSLSFGQYKPAPEYVLSHQAAVAKYDQDKAKYDALEKKLQNHDDPKWIDYFEAQNQIPILADILDTVVGFPLDAYVDRNGPPDTIYKDGKGNSIHTWLQVSASRKIQLWVNSKNIIYSWRYGPI